MHAAARAGCGWSLLLALLLCCCASGQSVERIGGAKTGMVPGKQDIIVSIQVEEQVCRPAASSIKACAAVLSLVLNTPSAFPPSFCLPCCSTPLQVTPIFSNGSVMGTWHQTSVGCKTCNLSDTEGARHGSTASFSMHMAERGHLRFTSESPHPSDRCGDMQDTYTCHAQHHMHGPC